MNENIGDECNDSLNESFIILSEYSDECRNEWSNGSSIDSTIEGQLNEVRASKHSEFLNFKEIEAVKSFSYGKDDDKSVSSEVCSDLSGVLVVSDSIMNQIDEKRLSKHGDVSVRAFGGCTIGGMKDKITPLLQKRPEFILMHIGTNNAPYD